MVDKIRRHIVAQKAKLIHGACSAQVTMETACKEEAYDDVLAYIDKLERREGPTAMERFAVVLDAAERAVGTRLTSERTMENTDIRMLVVKQMRDEGYSNAFIGVALSRDHSTVSCLFKRISEMLATPWAFSQFVRTYNRFKVNLGQ